MLRFLLSLTLLLTGFNSISADELYFPSFKEGILRNGRSEAIYKKKFVKERDKTKLTKLKNLENLYEKSYNLTLHNILTNSQPETPSIPKVIHVIWLGSPFPEKYEEWQNTWKNWDGWEYRLWTDLEVAELNLVNKDLYDASKNFGEKSDILRYEILYQFGGLYVDTDFACLNPDYFDVFHDFTDIYFGVEPIDYVPLRIGNSIIGSAPNHPFMLEVITRLGQNYEKYKGYNAVEKTGPAYITRLMADYLAVSEENIASVSLLPPTYFFPFTRTEIKHEFEEGLISIKPKHISKETCAIHFWEGSWNGRKQRKS